MYSSHRRGASPVPGGGGQSQYSWQDPLSAAPSSRIYGDLSQRHLTQGEEGEQRGRPPAGNGYGRSRSTTGHRLPGPGRAPTPPPYPIRFATTPVPGTRDGPYGALPKESHFRNFRSESPDTIGRASSRSNTSALSRPPSRDGRPVSRMFPRAAPSGSSASMLDNLTKSSPGTHRPVTTFATTRPMLELPFFPAYTPPPATERGFSRTLATALPNRSEQFKDGRRYNFGDRPTGTWEYGVPPPRALSPITRPGSFRRGSPTSLRPARREAQDPVAAMQQRITAEREGQRREVQQLSQAPEPTIPAEHVTFFMRRCTKTGIPIQLGKDYVKICHDAHVDPLSNGRLEDGPYKEFQDSRGLRYTVGGKRYDLRPRQL